MKKGKVHSVFHSIGYFTGLFAVSWIIGAVIAGLFAVGWIVGAVIVEA